MAKHNILGNKGEKIAVDYLVGLGYEIIEVNWQKHKYEIDVIAKDEAEMVFVEVKTRATSFYGKPEEAITTFKQTHLINGAEFYLEENEIDLDSRFDVISIILNDKVEEIRHIKSAFYSEV